MVREVKINLTKLSKFLDEINNGNLNNEALLEIVPILRKTFRQKVLNARHEGGVYEIPTQADLEILIMSNAGSPNHKPIRVPREAHYSKEYLRKKELMNQGPHTYLRLGILHGTKVKKGSDKVIMETDENAVTKDGFNYAKIQEQKKSYLKSTFYWSWEDIIKAIIETYVKSLV